MSFYLDWWGAEGYPEGQSRIELRSGKIVEGKIVSYKKGNLRITDTAGEKTRESIQNIKRILFSRHSQVEIELRSGDVLAGTIVSYENKHLQLIDETGKKIRGPINSVKQISFNRHPQPEADED